MDTVEEADALRERINAAFADVPMPTRGEMVRFDSLDERWCAAELGGKARSDVDVSMFFIDCFCIMPMLAVHYYFPAALLFLLDHRYRAEQSVLESVIGYLDRRNQREYPQFSAPQRRCIIDWLQFVRDTMVEYGDEDASVNYLDRPRDRSRYDFDRFTDRFKRRLPLIKAQWVAQSDPGAGSCV